MQKSAVNLMSHIWIMVYITDLNANSILNKRNKLTQERPLMWSFCIISVSALNSCLKYNKIYRHSIGKCSKNILASVL